MIEIRPHVGLRGEVEQDTGIDGVWLLGPSEPANGRRIGFVARSVSAPLQLTERGISDFIIRQAIDAINQRYGGSDREYTEPPEMPIDRFESKKKRTKGKR